MLWAFLDQVLRDGKEAACLTATAAVLEVASGPYSGKETGETALLRNRLDSFSPGDLLVADRFKLWNATSGTLLVRFQAHPQLVNDFVVTPDGQQLITVGYDGTIRQGNLKEVLAAASERKQP